MDKGKQGEQLFSQIMQSRNYKVKDVSGDPQYWDKDIDFIITSPASGLTKTFEVKWDNYIHKTNNLFIETSNPRSKCGRGWFEFCRADILAYGDSRNKIFYMIEMDKLREFIYSRNLPQIRTGDGACGFLISIDDIQEILGGIL